MLEELDYRKIKRIRDKKFVAALKRQKQEMTKHHKKFQADTGAIFKAGGLPKKVEKFKCLADANYHDKESPQNKKYLEMIQDTSHKITRKLIDLHLIKKSQDVIVETSEVNESESDL